MTVEWAAAGILLTVFVYFVVGGRWTGRIERGQEAMRELIDVKFGNIEDGMSSILAEITRLRDAKHDMAGVVMRHEGAIKSLQVDVHRLDARMAIIEKRPWGEQRLMTPHQSDE